MSLRISRVEGRHTRTASLGLLIGASAVLSLASATAEAGTYINWTRTHFTGATPLATDPDFLLIQHQDTFGDATRAAHAALDSLGAGVVTTDVGGTLRAGWAASDVIFQSDIPGVSLANVELGGQLRGILEATAANLVFSRSQANVHVDILIRHGITQVAGSPFAFHRNVSASAGAQEPNPVPWAGQTIDQFVGQAFQVPVGVPLHLQVQLSVFAFAQVGGRGTASFNQSYTLNPFEVFAIHTEGVTVNAPSIDLVDNQFVTIIPEPTSLALLMVGAAALLRRRRKQA